VTPPLVSIRIVTYNQEKFIGAAIESALAQNYRPLQIVVADDGSTDNTIERVRTYARQYADDILVVGDGRHIGITANSNRAMAACAGDLIAFLDGDDLFLPGKISAQQRWFAEDNSRVLCGHDVAHFDDRTGHEIALHSKICHMTQGHGPSEFLQRGPIFVASSVMVRKSAIPTHGYDSRLRWLSDWKLWIDCLVGGGAFGYIPDVLGRYRQHDTNVSMRESLSVECWADALTTLALVEAEHPDLWTPCRYGRARLYHQQGVAALQQGNAELARTQLGRSIISAPDRSAKVVAWWLLANLPGSARRRVLRRWGSRT
jgi:glycosyltransferase involved in cell wall biosynthesis